MDPGSAQQEPGHEMPAISKLTIRPGPSPDESPNLPIDVIVTILNKLTFKDLPSAARRTLVNVLKIRPGSHGWSDSSLEERAHTLLPDIKDHLETFSEFIGGNYRWGFYTTLVAGIDKKMRIVFSVENERLTMREGGFPVPQELRYRLPSDFGESRSSGAAGSQVPPLV